LVFNTAPNSKKYLCSVNHANQKNHRSDNDRQQTLLRPHALR
jgi:hypothetical protein